jgi:hypothetical protein
MLRWATTASMRRRARARREGRRRGQARCCAGRRRPRDATGQGTPRGTTTRAGAMLRWATRALTRRAASMDRAIRNDLRFPPTTHPQLQPPCHHRRKTPGGGRHLKLQTLSTCCAGRRRPRWRDGPGHATRDDAAGRHDAALGDDGPDDATGKGAPRGTTPRAGTMLRWATTASMRRRARARRAGRRRGQARCCAGRRRPR